MSRDEQYRNSFVQYIQQSADSERWGLIADRLQLSGPLAIRYVKIRYADCYTVSLLSELGNLYKVRGVLLQIFSSTSVYTNIDIAQLKIDLNSSNSVQIYPKLSSIDIEVGGNVSGKKGKQL